MTEHIKTPELRFPEFKDKWNQINLKEICDITSSKRIYAKDYVRRGIPFFRGKEISSNGFKHQEDLLYISEEIYNYFSEKYGSPKEGDLLITSVGTIGNVALVPSDFKFYFKDGNLIWLKDIKMNSHFLKYYLESFQGKKRLLDKASGSNQKALTISGLESLKVNTTNNNEEIKIKNFFNKLDRQIELEEQKLAKLEEQKKGYMQKIFSQELRFKDENGEDYPEWEETTVKEIASITTGNKDTKDAIENGKYEFYVRSPKIHKINSYSFDGEAVLTVGDGVGVGKVFHYVNGKFDYHQRVYKISDFNNYNALLFYYYFSTHFLREAQKYNAKTSVDSVRRDMIINMKIPNIIIEEQGKISNFLSKLDELINKHGQKIEDLKIRKQGFLQKMFV
ncbi:restriction endonuclease subunit S [Mammaliicoccus sciuri]|uniref:restriction endonuclease subunit S n=1 Tax=Mammaliicoccus sciuri TaxID=1296 RepID=UPI003F565EAD